MTNFGNVPICFQGLTKVSKSILKPSKPTKTVRIKEPNEQVSESTQEMDPSPDSDTITLEVKNSSGANAESSKQEDIDKKSSLKNSALEGETLVKSILKNDTAAKVFVTKVEMDIPNQELLAALNFNTSGGDKRRSVYENVDSNETPQTIMEESENVEEDYENDTFHLAKDSALFSQVSRSAIVSSPSVGSVPKQEDNPCKVVEVKAKEITKAKFTEQVVLPQTADHLGPQTVEIVEIIEDTETEPESSAPDTDPEDRWPSPITTRKVDGSHKQRKTCLAPGEILAKRQKLASDEALRSLKHFSGSKLDPEVENETVEHVSGKKSERDAQTTALLDAASASLQVSPENSKPLRLSFPHSEEQTQTPPSTPHEKPSNLSSPLCLQMTDKVNRVDQTKVKTFDGETPKRQALDNSKEVTLRKEVEVSKTYQIIGSFAKPGKEVTHLTVPVVEDNDSFYGSDKETDDVIVFSEDEGRVDFGDDTSSSDDEFHSSISQDIEESNVKVGRIQL